MLESIGSRLPVQPQSTPAARPESKGAALPQDSVALGSTPSLPKGIVFKAAPGCGDGQPCPDQPAPANKKWTILVWGAGDNNLLPYEINNFKDVEKVGSTADVNVVTQFDQGGRKGADRIYLEKGTAPAGKLASPSVEHLGKVDMADPDTMADFIKWGMEKYPADHYMFIVNDHGAGWQGCIEDDSADTFMTLPNLHKALQNAQDATGKKIDVLGFDACLMAMAEVGDELKDNASFLVGSQETEGGAGWPYSTVLTSQLLKGLNAMLTSKLPVEPADVAKATVRSASTTQEDLPTMSAYDLSKMGTLREAVNTFSSAFVKDGAISTSALPGIVNNTQGFFEYNDLHSFCDLIKAEASSSDELKAAAQGVQDAIAGMVIGEQHSSSYPEAHGVSIDLITTSSDYGDLEFAKDSSWMAVQSKINSALSQRSPEAV